MSDAISGRVFDIAAELFAMLSTPTRLRILYELCEGEKNVSQLLAKVDVSQPNISQHLGVLYRGGVLGRRRAGAQIFYHVVSSQAIMLCDVLCSERQALQSLRGFRA